GEAVRAFAELTTADAPRGALVAVTGPVDWATMGGGAAAAARSAAQQSSLHSSVRIRTGGDASVDARAVTGLATGASMVQTAPTPTGTGIGVKVAAGVVALAVAGFGAYRFLGSASPPPAAPAGTPAPTASVAPTAAPTGSAKVAAAPGTCPQGMALISGGKVFLGARDLTPDAKPPHEATISTFCLDKTEVTTRAYLACVEKGECERPPEKVSWPGITPQQVKLYSGFCN